MSIVEKMGVRRMVFVGALGVASLSGCDRSDILQSYYPTYEAAVQDGAIGRGWVPGFLPRSAQQIREVHNLDTNETWVAFDFVWEDGTLLEAACTSVSVELVILPRERSTEAYVPWWPQQLLGQVTAASEEFSFYQCREMDLGERFQAYLALERARSKAWFWRYRSH